jgi:hypothetical protein
MHIRRAYDKLNIIMRSRSQALQQSGLHDLVRVGLRRYECHAVPLAGRCHGPGAMLASIARRSSYAFTQALKHVRGHAALGGLSRVGAPHSTVASSHLRRCPTLSTRTGVLY